MSLGITSSPSLEIFSKRLSDLCLTGQLEGDKPQSNHVKRKRKVDEKQLDASVPGADWIHNPTSIVDSYISSAGSLLLLVQENYLKTYSAIESVTKAALSLSDADVMMNGVVCKFIIQCFLSQLFFKD